MAPFPALLTVLLLATPILIWKARRARRRRVSLRYLAQELGFRFEERVTREISRLPLFRRGHSPRAYNALVGTTPAGHEIVVMDYSYLIGSGRRRRTYVQTVALFLEVGDGVPSFALAPERLRDRIGEIFGSQDIDFDADPEFSKQFLLRGSDESRIRALFGTRVRKTLLSDFGAWSLQAGGGQILAFRDRRLVDANELRPFLSEVARLADALGLRPVLRLDAARKR